MAETLATTRFGQDLSRPECVLATRRGDIYVADARGGATVIHADGHQTRLWAKHPPDGFLPNGIALMPDGTLLIANLGPDGGVWRLAKDLSLAPYIMSVDGTELPPTNFVTTDARGRIWITVSTRARPRWDAFRRDRRDGYIVQVAGDTVRIVADGLGWTNEIAFDATGEYLYVNETTARCTSRFPIRGDGSLGAREVIVEYGPGVYPDGLALDADGGIWTASVIGNQLIRTSAGGRQSIVLADTDDDLLMAAEAAFTTGTLSPALIARGAISSLSNLSSIAFGSANLRSGFLGSLAGTHLTRFQSPFAGLPPPHWDF
jgi:sugar lactone lactonase YvrE